MEISEIKIIHTTIGKISLLENGIVRVLGNPNIDIEIDDMKENDIAFNKLLNGQAAPFLVIFGDNTNISNEARGYFSNKERSKIKIAEALVTPQIHHKITARFHYNVNKPSHPTEMFQQENEALLWLKQFLK